ncbi:MAG: benzoyl-CoA-dihydrodiol lyase, partial [Myxococcales bacterium]|nr:benzoyl-CoA-dihydrodiol lyase [Myxococcales bacterium]
MADDANAKVPSHLPLDTHPDQYLHWKLSFEGPVAKLVMDVQQDRALGGADYILKLNSYDLGVDIELADAVQRIRFEHPEVKVLMITSDQDRVFCSGANIYMLGSSTHSFKVNFCKYTNETRLGLEDLADSSGVATVAACNGTASGGGYELALACQKIALVDDGNSAVSFPEAPLLAVLPGTGGLTRLVDKRKVRRDRADVFSTVAEGIRGKRAVQWNLVDHVVPRSRWEEHMGKICGDLEKGARERKGAGITLSPVGAQYTDDGLSYEYVTLSLDHGKKTGTLTVRGPNKPQPENAEGLHAAGDQAWVVKAFRELDDCLVRLRFEFPKVGYLSLRTEGDLDAVLQAERGLLNAKEDWLGNEVIHLIKRVMKRLDLTARSMFALVEPGSCFGGILLEMALLADRVYMLDDPDGLVEVAISPLNGGAYPMANGLSRLETRFLGEPERPAELLARQGERMDTPEADAMGLVTDAPDDLDWEDTV